MDRQRLPAGCLGIQKVEISPVHFTEGKLVLYWTNYTLIYFDSNMINNELKR